MSTSDDIHNTTATGKCPFHQGGHDQSAGGAQPRATGGKINSVLTC